VRSPVQNPVPRPGVYGSRGFGLVWDGVWHHALRVRSGWRALRITNYIATGRRIVLLTVFDKQRRRERAEIARTVRTMERCIADRHIAEDGDD
jgi:hypothetical protein